MSWEAPLSPEPSGAREWAGEVERLIDAGDRAGALKLYLKDMPPEILEAVQSFPPMIEQAGSLRPDAESLAWAESVPHAASWRRTAGAQHTWQPDSMAEELAGFMRTLGSPKAS
ncbi:hypothetical protein [Homoserinimonas sp. A520]